MLAPLIHKKKLFKVKTKPIIVPFRRCEQCPVPRRVPFYPALPLSLAPLLLNPATTAASLCRAGFQSGGVQDFGKAFGIVLGQTS
jgi:hypothetical protein